MTPATATPKHTEQAVDLDTIRPFRVSIPESKIVELRFFGGLNVEETAEILGVSAATVMRDWKVAKVWLLRELRRS